MQVYQAKDVVASAEADLIRRFIVRNNTVPAFNFETRLREAVTRRKPICCLTPIQSAA